MKKKIEFLALLVMVLVFGTTVVGCGDTNLSGTWKLNTSYTGAASGKLYTGTNTITFSGRNFETNHSGDYKNQLSSTPFDKPTKGTYTVSDGYIKFHVTAVRNSDDSNWESWSGPDIERTLIRTEDRIEIENYWFTR